MEPSDAGAGAYLAAKGARDVASGLIAVALLLTGAPKPIGWFLIAAAVIPVADAIIMLRHHGPRATALGVHGATAAFLVVVAGLLLIR